MTIYLTLFNQKTVKNQYFWRKKIALPITLNIKKSEILLRLQKKDSKEPIFLRKKNCPTYNLKCKKKKKKKKKKWNIT